MGFRDMRWRTNVEPPEFKVGDEVCYRTSGINHTSTVIDIKWTTDEDGDRYQDVMTVENPYWLPASQFVRVRRIS